MIRALLSASLLVLAALPANAEVSDAAIIKAAQTDRALREMSTMLLAFELLDEEHLARSIIPIPPIVTCRAYGLSMDARMAEVLPAWNTFVVSVFHDAFDEEAIAAFVAQDDPPMIGDMERMPPELDAAGKARRDEAQGIMDTLLAGLKADFAALARREGTFVEPGEADGDLPFPDDDSEVDLTRCISAEAADHYADTLTHDEGTR